MANLRKEAKGRECQVRLPGICNGNNETVVLATTGYREYAVPESSRLTFSAHGAALRVMTK